MKNKNPVSAGLCMTKQQKAERAKNLLEIAKLHLEKWQINGDIKLLLIANQLKTASNHWVNG